MVYENKKEEERVILFAICREDEQKVRASLDELEELVATAGAETLAVMIQNKTVPDAASYLGKGKIEELKEFVITMDATGVVCDDELSPAQMKNLEEKLACKVMDRTMVILDIFAKRARTSEGKIQVELAQLKYQSSRLTGKGTAMSRLGGGIGTRGPGEKKLETDKRLIKNRILQLKKELAQVVENREVQRRQRQKNEIPVFAIVGYTNAGKSTLLNVLTQEDILAEDKLFATLDTTTRAFLLPGKQQALLTDTVGFIHKLPHHLVDAFKSTLEEAKYANYLLHIVDASNPAMEMQMKTVYATLDTLGVKNKKILTVFNKTDKLEKKEFFRDERACDSICISAKQMTGLDLLCDKMAQLLREDKFYIDTVLGYNQMSLLEKIHKKGEILTEEYVANGIHIVAYLPDEYSYLFFRQNDENFVEK